MTGSRHGRKEAPASPALSAISWVREQPPGSLSGRTRTSLNKDRVHVTVGPPTCSARRVLSILVLSLRQEEAPPRGGALTARSSGMGPGTLRTEHESCLYDPVGGPAVLGTAGHPVPLREGGVRARAHEGPHVPGPALPGGPASRLCLGAPDPTTGPSPCGEGRGPRSPCWRGKASYSLARGPDAQESGGRGEQERDRGMAGRACWQDYARRDGRGRRVPTFPVWASKKRSKHRFGMALCSPKSACSVLGRPHYQPGQRSGQRTMQCKPPPPGTRVSLSEEQAQGLVLAGRSVQTCP